MKISGNIIQIDKNKENPLRQKARPVHKDEFGTAHLKEIIEVMKKTLAKEEDGVAIAAPQIGLSLRIFVVAKSAYNEDVKNKQLVFINPKLVKKSKKKIELQEGCLSVRWVYGTTKRSVSATIEAQDIDGNKFTYGASGLIAHIFQHEVEHLDGILFTDHGYDFEEYSEEDIRKSRTRK
ncbi:MAG: peptide deformylase, peptide deformylase [Candidatus Nomurabacteria bacterium]|nr:peptide deformylase, peptide deformylase [Candidatus Nomurabacteria bacterium]